MRRNFPRQNLSRRGEDGYNLVFLAVAVTVLNIMVAVALPAWSHIIQRHKEEELIFRGLQYAEAIRVFQIRQNRLPVRLEELIEVEPRSIRQLWTNPLAEDGAWLLLPAQQAGQPGQPGQGQPLQPLPGSQDGGAPKPSAGGENGAQPGAPRPGAAGRPIQQVGAGPIRVVPKRPGAIDFSSNPGPTIPFMGVASPEGDTAIKNFAGSDEIRQWRFTVQLASQLRHDPHKNYAHPISSTDFWKPFPPNLNLPQMAGNGIGADKQPAGAGGLGDFRNPGPGPGQNPGNSNRPKQ